MQMTDYLELIKTNPQAFCNSRDKQSIRIVTDAAVIRKAEADLKKQIGIVYEDEYIRLLRDLVIFPNGDTGTYIRIVNAKNGVGCICLAVCEDRVLFVEHFRHALRRFSLELPRGFGEDGLSPEKNAEKELFEECGISISECRALGRISADSGISSDEPCVVLVHTNSRSISFNDRIEPIKNAFWLTVDEIYQAISNGTLTDGLSIAAVALAVAKGEIK